MDLIDIFDIVVRAVKNVLLTFAVTWSITTFVLFLVFAEKLMNN